MTGLGRYVSLDVLVRLHGSPVGTIRVPVVEGRCTSTAIASAIREQLSWPVVHHLLRDALLHGPPEVLTLQGLPAATHPVRRGPWPLVTVAVCTRDRPHLVETCLRGLLGLEYPSLELLVVDNHPSTDETETLVRTRFPTVRYVREPRPGLDWARNRAIVVATGEVLAFTDDDVVVDRGWVRSLAAVFAESPEVMAVTGLVVPAELESEAQLLFEQYGGFGRGFERRWYRVGDHESAARIHGGTGKFGTGANMAYRRSVFAEIGGFDPALDVGTRTNGGGDLEMFFRVLAARHVLVYEPAAIVRHRHRATLPELERQLTDHGIGFYSYLARSLVACRGDRLPFARLGAWWFVHWNVRRAVLSLLRPARFPRALVKAELWGSIRGLGRYRVARREALRLERRFGPIEGLSPPCPHRPPRARDGRDRIAIRTVDVSRPLQGLSGLGPYRKVRVYVTREGRAVGSVDVDSHGHDVGATRLADAIVAGLGIRVLGAPDVTSCHLTWPAVASAVLDALVPTSPGTTRPALGRDVPVSVVVATYDRPDELRRCLTALLGQDSDRDVEIVVVDNHPSSGLTAPVVAELPGVVMVTEPRQGLSYARNRGIAASRGAIVVTTDDDVVVSEGWLERLLEPFREPDVMVTTGLTLPLELETEAQLLFERYGGLSRGFDRRRFDNHWSECFVKRAVPTWEIGATANAAFRTEIFHHPDIGLFDEALGVGTPTGCSEDTYLFYKVLKAGYAIVYEPGALAWHHHRETVEQLRKQLYGYSKGHVAYHLTTLGRDHDLRSLLRLGVDLPLWRLRQVARLVTRRSDYPVGLIVTEIAGNLAGPASLWRSRRRVRRDGSSSPIADGARHSAPSPASDPDAARAADVVTALPR